MALVAVTLGGEAHVMGAGGPRVVPFDGFFLGPYTTALQPAEVLTEVVLPDHPDAVAVVVEHSRRHGDFAVVAVAAVGQPAADGTWRAVRIGLGGAAAQPRLAARASALLAGTRLEPDAVRAAAAAALDAAEPVSDVRASAEYRRHLIPSLVERALAGLRTGREKSRR
jgi:carbon-monoxide dehydrogenase medium subunit